MDISSEQAVSQEMTLMCSIYCNSETAIKEVLKLVTLSKLIQENSHELQSYCSVSVNYDSVTAVRQLIQMMYPFSFLIQMVVAGSVLWNVKFWPKVESKLQVHSYSASFIKASTETFRCGTQDTHFTRITQFCLLDCVR